MRDHGAVCFLLDGVEFSFSEVTQWQDIANTQTVDAVVKAVGFSPCQLTAIDDSGKLSTLLEEGIELVFLAGWGFVAA